MLRRLNSSSAHHHAWNPTTFFLLLLLSNSWLPLAHSSLKRSETRRSLTRHCCHIQWLESWTPTLPSILIYTYTSMVSLSLYIYNNNIHIYCIVVCVLYTKSRHSQLALSDRMLLCFISYSDCIYMCTFFIAASSTLFPFFTLPTTHIWLRIYTRARMRLALYPLVLAAYFFYDDECRHIFFLDGWMEEMPPPSFFDFLSLVLTRSIPTHRLTKSDGIKK